MPQQAFVPPIPVVVEAAPGGDDRVLEVSLQDPVTDPGGGEDHQQDRRRHHQGRLPEGEPQSDDEDRGVDHQAHPNQPTGQSQGEESESHGESPKRALPVFAQQAPLGGENLEESLAQGPEGLQPVAAGDAHRSLTARR